MVGVLIWGFLIGGIFIALLGYPGFARMIFRKERGKSLDHEGW